jgi:hypothetical protein
LDFDSTARFARGGSAALFALPLEKRDSRKDLAILVRQIGSAEKKLMPIFPRQTLPSRVRRAKNAGKIAAPLRVASNDERDGFRLSILKIRALFREISLSERVADALASNIRRLKDDVTRPSLVSL